MADHEHVWFNRWPDVDKLSLASLRQLLVTIDDLKDKMVMHHKNELLDMGKLPGLENLSENDHLKCIRFLQELRLISSVMYGSGITVYYPKELEELYIQIKKEIDHRDYKERPKPNFNKENSILSIGNKTVKIAQKNDKPNDHYILEYIFENDDGLTAKSYYSEILKAKFPMEKTNQRSLYRSCLAVNKKVIEQIGKSKFLIVKSGETGYVQINPDYL